MKEETYFLGLRINKNMRDYLYKYRHGKISSTARNIIQEHMESRDPLEVINQLVDQLERGQVHPKHFVMWFNEIKMRYRKTLALYDMANERIDELENSGIIQQALGRLRLQEIDKWIDK